MPPDPRPDEPPAARWRRLTATLWAVLLVAVCLRGAAQQWSHSLYPTYAAAGSYWRAGISLYQWPQPDRRLDCFRYSPLVAALLVPFNALPLDLGSALWRLLNGAVLLGGVAAWLRSPLPWPPDARQRAFVDLMILPLALGSLNNGQVNPLVAGLLLFTVAAAGSGRWNAAAACSALAGALKVYPLALGLLLAAAYPRRFAGRLVVALAAVAVLPFLFQHPGYVAGQYAEWFGVLGGGDRKSWPAHMAYRDLWLLFRVARLPVSPHAYLAIQVLAGAGCAAVCVAGRLRGWELPRVLTAALTLGTCWMMLCGPATESSTYVLLAPAVAWGVLSARAERWPVPVRWLPGAAAACLLAGVLAGVSPGARYVHALGPQPLGALLLFAAYAAVYLRALARGAVGSAAAAPLARAA